jgi:hypothetical protein
MKDFFPLRKGGHILGELDFAALSENLVAYIVFCQKTQNY